MKKISREELDKILLDHRAWMRGGAGLRANLTCRDMRGCDLRGVNFSCCDMRLSNLSGCDMRGSILINSNMRGCDLCDCDMSGCDLRDSDMRDSDMRDCNLNDSDMRGCDLSGYNMRQNNLRGSDMRGVNIDGEKIKLIPLQIDVFFWGILITDGFMRIGCQRHIHGAWSAFSDEEIGCMHPRAAEFWADNKIWLISLCDSYAEKAAKSAHTDIPTDELISIGVYCDLPWMLKTQAL